MAAPLRNPLTSARDVEDERRIRSLFPALVAHPNAPLLALRPYVERCPERFFNRAVHEVMLSWLLDRDARHGAHLRQYFVDHDAELSTALLFLRQINAEEWHDRPLVEGDDYEIVRFIDRVLHPAYLRLTEGVLAHLIRPIAHAARLDRGAQTEGMDVFNLVTELRAGPTAVCVEAYHHTIRNAIGHGGITLQHRDIRYQDKRANSETLDLWAVVRLCDDMVDACNALAAAVKVFLTLMQEQHYRIPHELLVEELIEGTSSPAWRISGCMRSELPNGTQLLVYAHPRSHDPLKVQWAAVHAAATAESLAPGYSRYFFSLRDKRNRAGWAAFDGTRLGTQRQAGATEVHQYATAIEESGYYYDPQPALPKFLRRIDTFAQVWRAQRPVLARRLRELRRLPEMLGREATAHRNAWGYVLTGAVIMPGLDVTTGAALIRKHKERIIAMAARTAFRETPRLSLTRYLPLGYARVAVLSHDFRRRRLGGFGLGPELVCTVQIQRIRRIRAPDIFGSTVETSGRWRIAWNRAWIESGGRTD